MSKTLKNDLKFINEHIAERITFDDIYKEKTMQERAKKAAYVVWTNYIFINPTTENLRDVKEEDYPTIKKLSYGAKNRLQSYLAFHLNKDHYEMSFDQLTEDQSYSVIRMCEEIFEDTKILVDWWRNPVENMSITGEDWFKQCKERFQHQKMINRLGFCFIDLNTKEFLIVSNDGMSWTRDQEMATRFNYSDADKKIKDQKSTAVTYAMDKKIKGIAVSRKLKMFTQSRNEMANDFIMEF